MSNHDRPRRQKLEARQRISQSYQQAPEPIENDIPQTAFAPGAEMQSKISGPTKKSVAQRSTLLAKSRPPFAKDTVEWETPGASIRKRKDVNEDSGDGEYTPRQPSKKQKITLETLDLSKAVDQSRGKTNDSSHVAGASELEKDALQSRPKLKPSRKTPLAPPSKDTLHPVEELSDDDFGDDTLVNDFVGYLPPKTPTPAERRAVGTPPLSPANTLPLERQNGESKSHTVPFIDQPHASSPLLSHLPSIPGQQHQSSEPTPPILSPGSKPAIKIRYTVIASRHPRLKKTRLPDFSLKNITLNALFDEISAFVPNAHIDRINLFLISDRTESSVCVTRYQSEVYEDMKIDFSQEIKNGARMGIREFELWMEPLSDGADGVRVDERMDMGSEDEDLPFSL